MAEFHADDSPSMIVFYRDYLMFQNNSPLPIKFSLSTTYELGKVFVLNLSQSDFLLEFRNNVYMYLESVEPCVVM